MSSVLPLSISVVKVRKLFRYEPLRSVIELGRVDVALGVDRHLMGMYGAPFSKPIVCQYLQRFAIDDENFSAFANVENPLILVWRQRQSARSSASEQLIQVLAF